MPNPWKIALRALALVLCGFEFAPRTKFPKGTRLHALAKIEDWHLKEHVDKEKLINWVIFLLGCDESQAEEKRTQMVGFFCDEEDLVDGFINACGQPPCYTAGECFDKNIAWVVVDGKIFCVTLDRLHPEDVVADVPFKIFFDLESVRQCGAYLDGLPIYDYRDKEWTTMSLSYARGGGRDSGDFDPLAFGLLAAIGSAVDAQARANGTQ